MGSNPTARAIIHLDMDAFYPAVEVLDQPGLRGKPVIVGGSRDRGVVASASYEAREVGVHSAQPVVTAMRLCPVAILLPVRMSRYREVSSRVFDIFNLYTPLVEPVSIDEAFLDVTGSIRLFGQPWDIAEKIKQRVFKEIGLTVSAGVAPSKFVAKIASDIKKPDGLTVVPPHRIRDFLAPLPISRMWGVGRATLEALTRLGVSTIGDLSKIPSETLEKRFGKHGIKMHLLSMGIDEREVSPEHEIKSIGHEQTYQRDIMEVGLARREILSLANRVARRMRREGMTGGTITLKVKYSDFVQITRATRLAEPTNDGMHIYDHCCDLLRKTRVGERPTRLLGVSVSRLVPADAEEQLALFVPTEERQKRKGLHEALDSVWEKFGEDSLRPGTLLTK